MVTQAGEGHATRLTNAWSFETDLSMAVRHLALSARSGPLTNHPSLLTDGGRDDDDDGINEKADDRDSYRSEMIIVTVTR